MADNANTSVVGIDNVAPVWQPDGRFTVWKLSEVYTGQLGEGKYVPKVEDLVYDPPSKTWYTCVSVDQTTLVARLERADPLKQNQEFSELDIFLGVGPGTITDTFRAYVNKAIFPHSLTIDQRITIKGSRAESVKIFRGNDVEGTAKVISALYNQNGQLTTNNIPLELAAIDGQNISVKCVPTCYTTEDLPNDEVLVMIAYGDDGQQVAKAEVLVENTQFVPNSDASTKYVTAIELKSPWLAESDPLLLQFPVNVTMSSLSLTGVVHYNDGSKIEMPVDQTKFSIYGFNNFIATVVGQKVPLVLDYQLSNNEVAVGLDTTPKRSIVKDYSAITTNQDGNYTPKLFGYPVWIDALNGYRLEWWLYDLDRDLATLATPFVSFTNESPAFNPVGYGYKQSLKVAVNLKDVNVSSRAINHVQSIDIILRQPGTARTTNWAIGWDPSMETFYGEGNAAKTHFVNDNLTQLDITLGETDFVAWYNRIFTLTKPLFDPRRETEAPDPTHFSVATRDWSADYPIYQWNQVLNVGHAIPNNSTVFIKFFIRSGDGDIQLTCAGLPVYQQN